MYGSKNIENHALTLMNIFIYDFEFKTFFMQIWV